MFDEENPEEKSKHEQESESTAYEKVWNNWSSYLEKGKTEGQKKVDDVACFKCKYV